MPNAAMIALPDPIAQARTAARDRSRAAVAATLGATAGRHASWPAAAMSGHFGSVQTVLNRTCHGVDSWRLVRVTRLWPCNVERCVCNIV